MSYNSFGSKTEVCDDFELSQRQSDPVAHRYVYDSPLIFDCHTAEVRVDRRNSRLTTAHLELEKL